MLSQGLSSGYWQSRQKIPEWQTWAGYAFEAICYKHLRQIRDALGIDPGSIANAWRYVPRNDEERVRGAQIDLLFDRPDETITLCEIKFSKEPFVVDKSYAEILQRKVDTFRKITGTKKQLFIALISASGIKPTQYSEDLISQVVTLDDLFVDYT